jgi:hypothetical protein
LRTEITTAPSLQARVGFESEVHPSWTGFAADVLLRACEHYGGVSTWRSIHRIRLVPGELSGFLPWLKGVRNTFRLPSAFEISPQDRRAVFLDYPDSEHIGIFENGAVRIEPRAGARAVLPSADHRQSFRGLAKYRRWQPIDALYFFGYALTHYHALPFTLLQAQLVDLRRAGSRGEPWDVLEVELPADLPTHSRRQSFYFDSSGRLTRHDYHAEVAGWWARGAHFWNRQTVCGGFPISLERHVVLRFGAITVPPVVALHATFESAEVERVLTRQLMS